MSFEGSHTNTSHRDKNLLIIAHSYSNFVKDQVEALSKYFDHIYVLVRHNPIADISEYVPINYLKPFKASSVIDLTAKPVNISVITTDIIYLPITNQYKKLGEKHFKIVDKVIREKNISFDLIHAHFTWSAGYVGSKLKDKYGVPFILTVHENREWFLKEYKSGDEGIYYAWENADRIIRVNQVDVSLLKEFNNNVISIPNGFDSRIFFKLDAIEARQSLKLPRDKKIVLSIGQLTKRKGFDYLIEAIGYVAKKEKDILCLICGEGEQRNYLNNKIRKLRLQDKIDLIGFVPHNKLFLWINACDVFVLPSLAEGNPTVMFECLGCGKSFVGTKVGGIPEVITSEDYGLLCEPGNPTDLAEKILIALDKEWDTEKIVRYAEQFTWENIAKEVLKVYESTIGLSSKS